MLGFFPLHVNTFQICFTGKFCIILLKILIAHIIYCSDIPKFIIEISAI